MDKQQTIKGMITLEGTGLHQGEKTKIEIMPAGPNTGIIFIRRDLANSPIIKADLYSLTDPEKFPRRTTIGAEGVYVHTIEHFMAALNILHIDNVQVNIWGEELPGLDGSSKVFVDKIKEVGIQEQEAPKKYLVLKEPVWIEEGLANIVALPYPYLRISYSLKFDNPLIGAKYMDIKFDPEFNDNLYEARTFCLEEEVKPLLDSGLGKGANYENTLVVSKEGVVNNKLRFPDEFIKHKILDLVGDLYLAGPLQAHIIAIRGGHSLNIKLLQKFKKYREKALTSAVKSEKETSVYDGKELNIVGIMDILPHRYPFLLVDKIIDFKAGEKVVGIKNVTMNEHFFQGHFPGKPVMPGVLIVEAMAQVGGVLMLGSPQHRGKLAFFMAANEVKFRKTVEPGDQLVLEINAGKVRGKTGVVYGKAYVSEKLVAEAELMFALVEN